MKPLAARMRPKSFDQFRGHEKVIRDLQSMIVDHPSVIFWGPPGTGKTTLALLLAREYGLPLRELSATVDGIKDLRKIIEESSQESVLLFVDEIHRWNKAQQDALLSFVEDGRILLLGATTENPGHYINRSLLSRTRLFQLEPLREEDIIEIIQEAAQKEGTELSDTRSKDIARQAEGDARRALLLLENEAGVEARGSVQDRYDLVSAWIKSMRASDPDAALYWMARLEDSGEDPRYLARRMSIFASEDVGLARSGAAAILDGIAGSVERIGEPECWITLAHGTVYLAQAPKSRLAYDAWRWAQSEVQRKRATVPHPLRQNNSVTRQFGEQYSLDQTEGFLPEGIKRFF